MSVRQGSMLNACIIHHVYKCKGGRDVDQAGSGVVSHFIVGASVVRSSQGGKKKHNAHTRTI